MKSNVAAFGKTLIVVYLFAIHIFAVRFIYDRFLEQYFSKESVEAERVKDPTEKTEVPTPQEIPSVTAEETPIAQNETDTNQSDNNQPASANTNQAIVNQTAPANAQDSNYGGKIMIPVVGIKREQIRDTFTDARSEGRVHNANDIMAAGGTPVVACADGEIVKFFDSARGGITIYQFSADHKFIYYYAHLKARADNLKEHDFVKQGTLIGYVGDTGDAAPGNTHLHFEIMIPEDPKKFWKGTDINPYPLLKEGIEAH